MTIALTQPDRVEHLDRAGGRIMRLLLDSAATAGTLAVLMCDVPAGSPGPPLHTHPGSDETFVVVDGSLLVHAEGETHTVAAGGSVFLPRGSAHTFATANDSAARFLAIHSPGGFEQMHRAIHAAEAQAGRTFTAEDIIPIAQGYDWALVGPPLLPTGQLAPSPGGAE